MKKRKYCSDCLLSKYFKGESLLSCGYICYKNPFKPETKGLIGYCEKEIK